MGGEEEGAPIEAADTTAVTDTSNSKNEYSKESK
jgi:hypothetical protein